MGFLAEILANVILIVGFYLVGWCIKHKEATAALLAVALVIIDIITIYNIIQRK